MSPTSSLSRRTLLKVSGTGAIALSLPLSVFTNEASAEPAPAELRRASYLGQLGQAFAVSGGPTLTLISVDDVGGAKSNAALVGSDDAFVLSFDGGAGTSLPAGIHELAHPVLGPVSLFVSQVDAGSDGHFEVVVDRSVPLPTALRAAPSVPAAAAATSGAAFSAAAIPAAAQALVQRLKVTAKARRAGRHVAVDLRFPGGGIQGVEVQLLRHGTLLATATALVKRGAATTALKPRHSLARGRYDVVITATTARGATKSVVRSVSLR